MTEKQDGKVNREEQIAEMANIVAHYFKDPIDIPCPYCEAAKALYEAGYRLVPPVDEKLRKEVTVMPIVVENESDAHIVTLNVGVQHFRLNGYFTKEEAEWMAEMLRKALNTLFQSAQAEAVRQERERIRKELITEISQHIHESPACSYKYCLSGRYWQALKAEFQEGK